MMLQWDTLPPTALTDEAGTAERQREGLRTAERNKRIGLVFYGFLACLGVYASGWLLHWLWDRLFLI